MSDLDKKSRLDRSLAGGIAWTAGAKWATQIFSWASLVITARLLSRADYGIGEMAGFFFALTNTMAEFGVGTSALHLTELDDDKLHQLHGFSLLLCTAVYLISIALSPLIAWFFHKPELVLVIFVSNLTFFITGFQAVPTGLLQRDMDYRKLSISEATLYLVQSATTVIGALLGWGYWALVVGTLTGKAANAAMVMYWKPLSFAWPKWKELRAPLEFGRHAATGNMAVTAYLHSDVIVTGRMLGDSALGTYRMALYLASAPAEKISMLIMRTAGPLFANLQSDPPLVRRYFLLLADTLSLAVVPAMVGLVMVAPEAVQVVLGQEWREAAGPLVWLAVYMIVATMSSLVGQVLMSQRMTKFTMRMSLVNLSVMPLAFVAGAHWGGIRGVAAAWVIASPITFLPSAIVLLRRINLTLRECVVTLWPTVLSAFVMLIALKATRTAVISTAWPLATKLFVQVAVGALTHSAVILIFFPNKLQRYVRFVRGVLGRKSAEPAVSASAAPL